MVLVPGQIDLVSLVLGLAAAPDEELDEVVTAALGTLASAVGAERAFVTLFHDDGTFSNSHEWTPGNVVPHQPAIQAVRQSDYPYSYWMARRGDVLAVATLAELPEEAEPERVSFGSFGVHGVLQVPVTYAEQVIGVVGFNTFDPTNRWSPTFVEDVTRVGRAIGVALHRRRTAERARAALQLAERSARAKDVLIETASHELRTPLHAVLGYAELLGLEGIRHTALDAIRDNGTHLLSMIDDLLELAQLASASTVEADDVSLDQLVADVVANLRPVAQRTSVRLADPRSSGSDMAVGQPIQVRKALHCAVSVAMSSAGPDGVILVRTDALDGNWAVTLDTSGPNAAAPTGLALGLGQAITEELGGRCAVLTRTNGATIEVWLPRQPGSATRP